MQEHQVGANQSTLCHFVPKLLLGYVNPSLDLKITVPLSSWASWDASILRQWLSVDLSFCRIER
jgi:hypothetical protein